MSIKVMTLVWESDLPPEQKYVLLKLADYADDDGDNVYPSVSTVARLTGVSDRTVQRALSAMRDGGILEVVNRATQHKATGYRIRGDKLTPLLNPGVTPVTPRGDTGDAPGVTPVSPYPSYNHQRTVKEDDDDARARPLAFTLYEQTIGTLDANVAQQIQEEIDDGWSEECQSHCFREASDHNARSWAYVRKIRRDHKARGCYAGKPRAGKDGRHDADADYAGLADAERFLASRG